MAEQTINITIGLTDELSAGIRNIVREFEQFQSQVRQHRDGTIGNLRVILREVEQVNAGLQQSQQRATSLSTAMRASLAIGREAAIGLARALPGMAGAVANVASSMGTILRVFAGFGLAGGVAAGIAAVPLFFVAAGAAVYAVSRRLAQAEQAKRNFSMRMGNETQANIRREQAVLQSLGMSAQQAQGVMVKMSDLVFDTARGIHSNLHQALEKFGAGGIQIAEATRKAMWEQGKGTKGAMDTLIREVSRQSPTLQRFIWQSLGFPHEIMMQHEKAQAQLPELYQRSAERQAALDRENDRMIKNVNALGVAFDNLFQKIRDAFFAYLAPILNMGLETILQKLGPEFMTPEQRQREIERPLTDWEKRFVDPKARKEYLDELRRQQELYERRRRSDVMPGGPGGAGYQPVALRDISQEQAEGNTTLVEIRDILAWIRNQQVEAGAGGAKVMLAGFGGAGAGGTWGGGGGGGGGAPSGGGGGDNSNPQGPATDSNPITGAGGEGVLYDPVTGTSLGGGVGGHSASRGAGGHQGDDIMAPLDSPVFAPKDGKITRIGTDNFGQPTVTIQHPDGTYTRILHMRQNFFKVGDSVTGGTKIGTSGTANGVAHIHYERWRGAPGQRGSQLINPRREHGWDKTRLPRGGQVAPRSPQQPPTAAPAPAKPQGTESTPQAKPDTPDVRAQTNEANSAVQLAAMQGESQNDMLAKAKQPSIQERAQQALKELKQYEGSWEQRIQRAIVGPSLREGETPRPGGEQTQHEHLRDLEFEQEKKLFNYEGYYDNPNWLEESKKYRPTGGDRASLGGATLAAFRQGRRGPPRFSPVPFEEMHPDWQQKTLELEQEEKVPPQYPGTYAGPSYKEGEVSDSPLKLWETMMEGQQERTGPRMDEPGGGRFPDFERRAESGGIILAKYDHGRAERASGAAQDWLGEAYDRRKGREDQLSRAIEDRSIMIDPEADTQDSADVRAQLAINVRGPRGYVSARATADGVFEDGFTFRQDATPNDDDTMTA